MAVSPAVRPEEVGLRAVGSVTSMESVTVRQLGVVSVAVGPVITAESVATTVRLVGVI